MVFIRCVCVCVSMLHNDIQVDFKCTQMTLGFGMLKMSSSCIVKCKDTTSLANSTLNNIFPLHTKSQDYHLTYLNVLL